jgi:hypothetical protein
LAVAKQQAESTNKQSKQLTLEDLVVEHLGAKCREDLVLHKVFFLGQRLCAVCLYLAMMVSV